MGKSVRSVFRWDRRGRLRRRFAAVGTIAAMVILSTGVGTPAMASGPAPVGLGTAASFAVLAGSTVTNTGPSVVSGDVGLYPGSSITGFPPAGPAVVNGTQHIGDAVAQQAKVDLTTAYNAAAGLTPATTVAGGLLGGLTLGPGVYTSGSSMGLTGTVTLDAGGNANAVFVFQMASTLTTASTSTVVLSGGAQACDVFWQVGSSATLGTNSTFVGSVLASTSATLTTGATVNGRILAGTGAVTLDTNTITVPACTTAPAPPPSTPPAATTITTAPSSSAITLGNSVNDVATVTGNATDGTPTGSVQFYACGAGSTSCASSSGTALTPVQPLNGGVATSPSFTPNAVGTDCFAAVYSPSGSTYAGSSETGSPITSECFTVTAAPAPPPSTPPAATSITTAPSSSAITLGNSVNDMATVTGNATDGTPTGSVQFYACGADSTSCASSSGTALTPVQPLNGGVATSPSFRPNAVGTYCFAAAYIPTGSIYAGTSETGSSINRECFTVTAAPTPPLRTQPAATTITTAPSGSSITLGASINDKAAVTGTATDGTPTGSVQFYACGPGSALCAPSLGTALTPAQPLNGGVATSPSFRPNAVGTYCFAAAYTPTGSIYAGTSEAGSPISRECFTVTAAATSPPAVRPPTTPPVVPSTHTGEPWAGWVYWLLVATAGVVGLILATGLVYRRNVSPHTGD